MSINFPEASAAASLFTMNTVKVFLTHFGSEPETGSPRAQVSHETME